MRVYCKMFLITFKTRCLRNILIITVEWISQLNDFFFFTIHIYLYPLLKVLIHLFHLNLNNSLKYHAMTLLYKLRMSLMH